MDRNDCILRVARPADEAAVTSVLASAYPAILAADYDPAVLAACLPAMVTANPKLLASGSYYVQETPDGQITACGGWTHEEPGTNAVQTGRAHLRHFATHPDWVRKGLGQAILERCLQDAHALTVETLTCFSSLSAVPFYQSQGFVVQKRTNLTMRGVAFAMIVMDLRHPPPAH